MRCGHRPGGRQGHAGGARSTEPVPRPARRPAPVVSLPPPVRRRAAGAPARRAARAGAGAAPAGRRVVRAAKASRSRRSATRWRAGTSRGRRTWSSSRSRRRASDRQEATLRRWLEALPDELIRRRPVLSDAYRRVAPRQGRGRGRRGAPARTPSGGSTLTAESLARTGPGRRRWSSSTRRRSAACRARSPSTGPAWPGSSATWPAPIAHARRALDLVGEDDHLGRGGAAALLGLAYWTSGDLEAASPFVRRQPWRAWRRPGTSPTSSAARIALADIRIAQGRLREALRIVRAGPGARRPRRARPCCGARRTCTSGMSAVAPRARRPRGRRGSTCGEPGAGRGERPAAEPAIGRASPWPAIRQAEGDLDGALELLDEAERLYVGDFSPDVRPVAAVRARVWIAQGGCRRRRTGRASAACRRPTTSATSTSSSTPPWPGCSWPRERATVPTRAIRERDRAPGAPAGSGGGRRAERERHRDPGRPGARPPRRGDVGGRARVAGAGGRRSPSRRATSASSSTKGRPWRRC